jgi:predicted transcriptional regulator of viral defense system
VPRFGAVLQGETPRWRLSGDDYLPSFSCKAVGDVLLEAAELHPGCQILVSVGVRTAAARSVFFNWTKRTNAFRAITLDLSGSACYTSSGDVNMPRRSVTPKGRPRRGKDRVLELARQAGVLRARDLDAEGIPREYLRRLLAEGLLDRRGWGIYVAAELKPTPNHTLAEASKRVPQGVVCLLSALQFHELTTRAPFEVWLAIGEKARLPKVKYPPLRIVRFSGPALADEVEEHRIEGVAVKVYSPAKTVADCFKYRNKIGLDVALEALRDCWKKRRATMDELWQAAKTCRVANVMRPYLESVT